MSVLISWLYFKDAYENNQTMMFFSIVQFLYNCIWACIQFGKPFCIRHICIRRHNKIISRINYLIYNLRKSLNMFWRPSRSFQNIHLHAKVSRLSPHILPEDTICLCTTAQEKEREDILFVILNWRCHLSMYQVVYPEECLEGFTPANSATSQITQGQFPHISTSFDNECQKHNIYNKIWRLKIKQRIMYLY